MNILYPFSSLLLGLILTQILATLHLYLSDADLYNSLMAIKDAGYLVIPNQNVIDGLRDFGPAFCGGVFFTFSIGAGISFFVLGLAWIRVRFFDRKKNILYLFILLWAGCLLALNFHGFKFMVTLYFLVIPPAIYAAATASIAYLNNQNRRSNEFIHILPVIVLALLLSLNSNSRMFTDFRDIFLLSNPVGSKINNFYYKYTLYPAEIFKSLDQKMLKTSRIDTLENRATGRALENILINHDYLPLKKNIDVDLKITPAENDFIFENRGEPVLRMPSRAFFANPDKAIKEFSNKRDAYHFFRQITFLSLLVGFPLAVYVIGHALISLASSLFFNLRTSSVIASALCFLLCLTLFASFHFYRSRDVSLKNLPDALNSDSWQRRVAALKIIDEKGLEVKQFRAYPRLVASLHIAERYWVVRTLASSRSSATYRDLLIFLDDPHPNVISMALYALGKRGNRQAITKILQIIKESDDWYSQWYAYQALRSLGWRQTQLN